MPLTEENATSLTLGLRESDRVMIQIPPSNSPTLVIVQLREIRDQHRARVKFTAPKQVKVDRECVYIAESNARKAAR